MHVDDPDLIEFVTVKNNYVKNTEFVSNRLIYLISASIYFRSYDFNQSNLLTFCCIQYSALQKLTGHGLFSELNPVLWKQQRRTISHAFSNLNVRHQIPILQQKLQVMMDKFDQKSAAKQAVRVENYNLNI